MGQLSLFVETRRESWADKQQTLTGQKKRIVEQFRCHSCGGELDAKEAYYVDRYRVCKACKRHADHCGEIWAAHQDRDSVGKALVITLLLWCGAVAVCCFVIWGS